MWETEREMRTERERDKERERGCCERNEGGWQIQFWVHWIGMLMIAMLAMMNNMIKKIYKERKKEEKKDRDKRSWHLCCCWRTVHDFLEHVMTFILLIVFVLLTFRRLCFIVCSLLYVTRAKVIYSSPHLYNSFCHVMPHNCLCYSRCPEKFTGVITSWDVSRWPRTYPQNASHGAFFLLRFGVTDSHGTCVAFAKSHNCVHYVLTCCSMYLNSTNVNVWRVFFFAVQASLSVRHYGEKWQVHNKLDWP